MENGEGALTTGGTTTWGVMVHDEELTPTCNGNAPDLHVTDDSALAYWLGVPNSFWLFSQNFPVGTTTLTCTATDAAGNQGTVSLNITVTSTADTTPPTMQLWTISEIMGPPAIGDMPVSTGDSIMLFHDVDEWWVDDVGVVSITCSSDLIPAASLPGGSLHGLGWLEIDHSVWVVGIHFITCTATDAAGNVSPSSDGFFTITVTAPAPAPTSASGTFTITDGTNGGDCTSIGTWNSGSKTCLLYTSPSPRD